MEPSDPPVLTAKDVPISELLDDEVDVLARKVVEQAAPLSLTLRVEWEFLLLVPRADLAHDDWEEHHRSFVELIFRQLKGPASFSCCICGKETTAEIKATPQDSTTHWTVTGDDSIGTTWQEQQDFAALEDYESFPIEITSPKMRPRIPALGGDSASHVCEMSFQDEIRTVMHRLQDMFKGTGKHLLAHSSCGFHVHIGNEDPKEEEEVGFSLTTIKNLLCLSLAAERQLDKLHSADRITGSLIPTTGKCEPLVGDAYNNPLSLRFAASALDCRKILAGHPIKFRGATIKASAAPKSKALYWPLNDLSSPHMQEMATEFTTMAYLSLVQRAQSLVQLQYIGGNAVSLKPSVVNLLNLRELDVRQRKDKNTIEFRQAAATTDVDQILAWIEVCMAMVRFTHSTSPLDMAKLTTAILKTPSFDTLQLLKIMNVLDSTFVHFEKKLCESDAYVNSVYQAEMEKINSVAEQSPALVPFLRHLAKERRNDSVSENVCDIIDEKFLHGGYGLFDDEFLDAMFEEPLDDEGQQNKRELHFSHVPPGGFVESLPGKQS